MADESHHDANDLNDRLIETLLSDGSLKSPRVEAAFRSVLRHHFLPGTPLEEVYSTGPSSPGAIPTACRRAPPAIRSSWPGCWSSLMCGPVTGCSRSAPPPVTTPPCSGSGEAGTVTTVDIDPILAATAVENLRRAGVGRVEVVTGDGWAGAASDGWSVVPRRATRRRRP